MASAIAQETTRLITRESFRPIHAVRSTAVTFTRAFDALCALGMMVAAFIFLNVGRMPGEVQEFLSTRISVKNFGIAVLLVIIWHAVFAALGLYQAALVRSFRRAAIRIALACSLAALVMAPLTFASRSGAFDLRVVMLFWLVAVVAELGGRALIAAGARYAERKARRVRLAVIIGSGEQARGLWRAVEAREFNDLQIAGFVDTRDHAEMLPEIRDRIIGRLEQLEELLARTAIDQVLIALPVKSQYAAVEQALASCARMGVEAKYFPDIFSTPRARRAFDSDDEVPAVRVHHVADDHRLLVKRAMDVVVAGLALAVLSPVLLACAIAIKATSRGPVIFAQDRYGHNRRRFRMFKFRTMVEDAEALQPDLESRNEAHGPVFKIRQDPRITPIGGFLRRTSLDELPQLVNVIRGEMSLVGPRPLAVRDVLRFDAAWLMRRFSVQPGLTCLWQINGRSHTSFDDWARLDLDYIDNWSLVLDVRILMKTVPVVLSRSGAM